MARYSSVPSIRILAALNEKGITEKEVWDCQLSLKRAGYIKLHAGYDEEPVNPTWSRAAPEFTITPKGLKWWLMRKHGAGYAKMVSDVERTKSECEKNGIFVVADWAERLKLPVLLVQKVLHAENL
jgi:hypothetical protein